MRRIWTDHGEGGKSEITTEDHVRFSFKDSKVSNNGTSTVRGQIPVILYKK